MVSSKHRSKVRVYAFLQTLGRGKVHSSFPSGGYLINAPDNGTEPASFLVQNALEFEGDTEP